MLFYDQYHSEFPEISDVVRLSHIVNYPDISEENEQKVIDALKMHKKDIEEGSSFATKAILYSDDPGSSSNGGLITNVKRGQMVPDFDAVVLSLHEGQTMEPSKTDHGNNIDMTS